MSPKIQCKCGCFLSYWSMPTHLKCKKHKLLMELREDNDNLKFLLKFRLLELKKQLLILK
jgi:hypothetical protein